MLRLSIRPLCPRDIILNCHMAWIRIAIFIGAGRMSSDDRVICFLGKMLKLPKTGTKTWLNKTTSFFLILIVFISNNNDFETEKQVFCFVAGESHFWSFLSLVIRTNANRFAQMLIGRRKHNLSLKYSYGGGSNKNGSDHSVFLYIFQKLTRRQSCTL